MLELPVMSLGTLNKFLTENAATVLKYVVLKIFLLSDQERIELFTFKNSAFVGKIDQQDYLTILDEALTVFVEVEQFEDAALCRDLITKISIDNVIRSS